jgi:membrane protein DedA with SNARE-associated domain
LSLSEYIVLFVLVAIMGAGLPGPGDASLIAAGTLAGEGRMDAGVVLGTAMAAWMLGSAAGFAIGAHGGRRHFLGAEIAQSIGRSGSRAVLGVALIVAIGLGIKVGVSRWRATRQGEQTAA